MLSRTAYSMICGSTYTASAARWNSSRRLGVDDRRRRLRGRDHPLDHDVLLGRGRVADEDLEHEPVELCLRQRVGALGLDRVLRRHDQERVRRRDSVSRPIVTCRSCITSSSALCTLAGARLISSASRRLVNTGPSETWNSPVALVVDAGADDVGGHQVGGELDPLELAADRLGERLDRHRLGEPGHALDEQVARGPAARRASAPAARPGPRSSS